MLLLETLSHRRPSASPHGDRTLKDGCRRGRLIQAPDQKFRGEPNLKDGCRRGRLIQAPDQKFRGEPNLMWWMA
ncbi:hypothetical protein LH464_18320, partial [Neorhizobium sp. T786]|nr:hypothetical protein [Neorhizobium xiangyangii]